MLECTPQNGTVLDGFPQLWSGNPSRAFTEASGHVTTVHVLSQFHSLRRKKVFLTGEYPSLCFHSFHKARVRACAGGRRSEMPRMCLRLNDETPQRSGTKSSAGEMIVYLSTALNSHLFLFFPFFLILKWFAFLGGWVITDGKTSLSALIRTRAHVLVTHPSWFFSITASG